MARIHAIWGLGQIARRDGRGRASGLGQVFEPLLADRDPEIRAQAAKAAGDARDRASLGKLIGLLADASPRVRFFAAMALGKLGDAEAAGPLLELLRRNDDQDPYLRHAAVMGLVGLNDRDALKRAARDPSPAVRMGVLLTLRRLEDPAVADSLNDADPRLVLEAARAINDVPIAAAMPRLAALATTASTPLPLLRRVANANFRTGGPENARRLAEIASGADYPEAIRAQALEMLGEWANPVGSGQGHGALAAARPAARGPGRPGAAAEA